MLPEGWRNCRLGDLFENRKERGRHGLPTLSVTMTDGLVDRDDLDRKQDTTLSPQEHLLVEAGDIAYNTMRMWQCAFGLADRDGMVSPAYVVLRAKSGTNPDFMAHLLRTPRMRYLLRAYSHGLTEDRLRLYFDDFAAIRAGIPKIEEQCRIALVLNAQDRSIAVAERLIANRKLQREVMFRQLLTTPKEMPIGSGRDARPRSTWRRSPLGEIAKISSGGTPDRGDPSLWNGAVPWVTTGEIRFNTIVETVEQITEKGLVQSAAKLFPPGTVLMAMYGQGRTRGQVAKLGIEAATNQACAAIQFKEGFDPEFYFQYLSAQYEALRELGNAGTQKNLNAGILKSLDVPVPPIDEQRAIARVFSTLDHEVASLEKQVRLLMDERAALAAELLMGKRRIRLDREGVAA